MMRINTHWHSMGALGAMLLTTSMASAATSITNSLTGFTGNSTQLATQNALNGVGLGFTSIAGFEDPNDPTVQFDSAGAHFGDLGLDATGRNFIRTTATDYANHSFTAEVTWTPSDPFVQAAYFGLGSGEYGSFRIADYDGQYAAVQLFMEVNDTPPLVETMKANSFRSVFTATEATGLDVAGTHRLRLTYDWYRKAMDFAIDVNYAGGPFTADITPVTQSTIDLYAKNGWPAEPARVYFGGDDGSTFKDLNITLTSGSTIFGDLNNSGTITVADWILLRNNQLADLSAMTFQQAYAAGDLTADKANNQADFAVFKQLYESANGAGSFAAIASVPEPTTGILVVTAGLVAVATRRRG